VERITVPQIAKPLLVDEDARGANEARLRRFHAASSEQGLMKLVAEASGGSRSGPTHIAPSAVWTSSRASREAS